MSQKEELEIILRQRKSEISRNVIYHAVSHAVISNHISNEHHIWLVPTSELSMSSSLVTDFSGRKTVIIQGQQFSTAVVGGLISKNSKIAELLITGGNSKITIDSPRGAITHTILRFTTYIPDRTEIKCYELIGRDYVVDTRWRVPIWPNPHQTEQDEIKKSASIKSNALISSKSELKYRPILDPAQERIKRNNYYNSTILVIEGGPGSGKTTTMIQRLKFLSDSIAVDDYGSSLTQSQQDIIRRNLIKWKFFSPNKFLRDYLQNSMQSEGLANSLDSVEVLSTFIINVFDSTFTSRRFRNVKKYDSDNRYYTGSKTQNQKFINRIIQRFCINYIQNRKTNLIQIKNHCNIDSDKDIINSIIAKTEDILNDKITIIKFANYIGNYFQLNSHFDSGLNYFDNKRNKFLKDVVKKIYENCLLNDDVLFDYYLIYEENNKSSNNNNILDLVEFSRSKKDLDEFIQFELRRLLKLKLSGDEKMILNIYPEFIQDYQQLLKWDYIVQSLKDQKRNAFQNYDQYVFEAFIETKQEFLVEEPNFYHKAYIESEYINNSEYLNLIDRSVLIVCLNKIYASLEFGNSKSLLLLDSYKYLNSMKLNVIGIDEVTDFHPFEVLCIESFLDKKLSSLTICGDLMQRLTKRGVRDWSDYFSSDRDFLIEQLNSSYRQGPKLLKAAFGLYRLTTKRSLEMRSVFDSYDIEPEPIYFCNESLDIRINYLISHIQKALEFYNNVCPSIGIFVHDENDIVTYMNVLRKHVKTLSIRLQVIGCFNGRDLQVQNAIKIFSLHYIKGLEFDVVFLMDFDKMMMTEGKRFAYRNAYIGISRSAFHFGIISGSNYGIENMSEFLNSNSNW